jgi:serine-type D-Ala-D-Ala carboxypeptidase/endopeptidase
VFGDVPVPSEAELRKILVQRIDEERQSVGLVVGLLEPTGRRLVSHGELERGDPRPLTGDTIFEIGSVTKVFTALLLMDMVERSEVALSDPVAMYLPAGITVPRRKGREITLQDLATHRSGLPRLPSNFLPADPSNPYRDYGVEQLYEFLSCYELPRDVDSQVEYSNLGFGLLGHALERRAGLDYESLLRARVLDPLAMSSTRMALTQEMNARLASGHDGKLERVGSWDLSTLAGAGALRSTANDLLTFLGAQLDDAAPPLRNAMTAMLRVPDPMGRESAIGWQVVTLDGTFTRDSHRIVWMSGATGGYLSFCGFEPVARTGVILLANAFSVSAMQPIIDLGLHLLDARFPLNQTSH